LQQKEDGYQPVGSHSDNASTKTGHEVTGIGRQDAGMTIDFPEPTRISVNGVELEVFEAGRQNAGNPIVLCHGWPGPAFSWRHQMPALAGRGLPRDRTVCLTTQACLDLLG
jgi:hypothetical protein